MQGRGLLAQLIQDLCCLPGVGPKSAQRMAFYLLQRDRQGALRLSETLARAGTDIGYCAQCRTFTEHKLCQYCENPGRDQSILCVVESPADVWAVEQSGTFKGLYFVLHGHLSPLDGIGPDELGLDKLQQQLAAGVVSEIILATNSTVEGEVTANLIADMARKCGIQATRIAHGVPMGGELEFIDSGTLAHAFKGRREI